jgi:hypothetical protein
MMNELIRKLAKKSGFRLDSNGIYTAKLEHLPITENMEKFAQLVIKECISLLPLDCQSKDGCHTSWTIKEHFGVE